MSVIGLSLVALLSTALLIAMPSLLPGPFTILIPMLAGLGLFILLAA